LRGEEEERNDVEEDQKEM